jgi:hypothetical protein
VVGWSEVVVASEFDKSVSGTVLMSEIDTNQLLRLVFISCDRYRGSLSLPYIVVVCCLKSKVNEHRV